MKIAFIGGLGHHYVHGLLREPGYSIQTAAASDGFDEASAKKWAAANGVDNWYATPQTMLEQFQPDLLSVGAVYSHNGYWAKQGVELGIPVVSDKPIATTWKQLADLEQAISEHKGVVLTEFDFRSRPGFRSAQQAIVRGDIGEVILANSQKSYRFGTRPDWYADRDTYGGTLLWVGSHGIDALRWVTGRGLKRVVGHGGNLSQKKFGSMEDHLALLFELDNGGTALAQADFLRPAAAPTHGDDRIRVAGSQGVVEVRDERCMLITSAKGPVDITDTVKVRPLAVELYEASRGNGCDYFSTETSLEMAKILLHSRDACDGAQWVEIKD